ncbi:MAG: hypothetical protein HYY03_00845 [Chloroflexi bacterium]|nr:hypothetical protein [Chloroflexota bacterium]
MPRGKKTPQHTAKAERMATHIEESAKREGRYKGRAEEVAWRTVHKDLPKREAHRQSKSRS